MPLDTFLLSVLCQVYSNTSPASVSSFSLQGLFALNLQDLKMADQKRTKNEKARLEKDGPNQMAGKW